MDKIKLKPCPFCGGEAKTVCLSTASDWNSYISKLYEIKCSKCGCATSKGYKINVEVDKAGDVVFSEPGRKEAVEMWNRRAKNE